VGYPVGKKGWKLYDLESKEIFVSRDVEFCEEILPFSKIAKENLAGKGSMPNGVVGIDTFDDQINLEHRSGDVVSPGENMDDCVDCTL